MRNHDWSFLMLSLGAILLAIGIVLPAGCQDISGSEWAMAGQNASNTRSQPFEIAIDPSNVSTLAPRWVFTTGGSVSATPTVAGNTVYFPDWAGNLYAVNATTGQQIWAAKISDYDGVPGAVSRVSPVLHGNDIILGDHMGELGPHKGTNLIAVNKQTGKLDWITQIETHPSAVVTGSAVVLGDVIYQGVGSVEEQYATSPTYPCCSFRGSIIAVDANTGKMIWRTYTIPDNGGAPNQYSGGGIWQPAVVDPFRGMIYVGTANNTTVPENVQACQADNLTATDCVDPNDHMDSVLGLDMKTGALKWAHRTEAYDVWTVACVGYPGNPCPSPPGEDNDFGGAGGNLLLNLVGFGQKSGEYWAFNPADGSTVWATAVGPHGNLGGIQWGTATDGQRIYVAESDNEYFSYTLASGQTINWGSWAALDAATGKILWQTPDPDSTAYDMGAVSVANGVVYAGSLDGHMYAMNAATGKILWKYATAGTILDGPSVVDGTVYWASGYPRSGGTPNNKVYAFSPAATGTPQ